MKYPAIYRSEDKSIYLYSDKDNYYCFTRGFWDKSEEMDNHESDTNITHEYLQNTWGVVESKEHAEFIIELAELHGFEFNSNGSPGSFFTINNNALYFYSFEVSIKRVSSDRKQITIPLPPKEVEAVDEWPKLGGKAVLGGCAVIVNGLHNDLAWCSYMENNECIITTKISNLSKPKSKQDLLIEELQTKLCNNNAVDNYILACDIINGEIEGLSYEY